MQLLVSVTDAGEARAALAGGADVIDAKNPRRGSLGAVTSRTLRAICAAVSNRRPVSAALGDATDGASIVRAVSAAADAGVTYVKVGFRGIASLARVRCLAAAASGETRVRLILVGYADWERAAGPSPGVILDVAAAVHASGVLMDTAFKDAGLFNVIARESVAGWVAAARASGLLVAVAGSLQGSDLHTARDTGADIAGVRGAACIGGRTGCVAVGKVAALSALLNRAPRGHTIARV